jgi:hypothetical protein
MRFNIREVAPPPSYPPSARTLSDSVTFLGTDPVFSMICYSNRNVYQNISGYVSDLLDADVLEELKMSKQIPPTKITS